MLLLLGDLPEDIAHAVRIAVAHAEQALHVLLGHRVIPELESEQAHGVDDVGIARIGREQRFELLARLGEALVEHQRARIVHARLA